jgi:GAF domain-containing protein
LSAYVTGKADLKLHFAGGYAYVPGRGDPLEFALGEGLVGRAGLDREPKLVNTGITSASAASAEKQPEGVRVRLGLGDLRPRQVLLQPFLYGERLSGVVELATIHEFSEAGLEFLEGISESLGTAFHTAQTREQVNALLQKTQMQAEELLAREEELRAMNEELQAQAESIRRGRNENRTRTEG